MLKTSFEKQVCSRCQGSGEYSFCLGYGKRCFKCQGSCEVLTKRGAAALAYYISLCEVSSLDLKIGDIVQTTSVTTSASLYRYRAKILDIGPGGFTHTSSLVNGEMVPKSVQSIRLSLENAKHGKSSMHIWESSKVRVFRADDSVRIELALAYQLTLTKTGQVKKNKLK